MASREILEVLGRDHVIINSLLEQIMDCDPDDKTSKQDLYDRLQLELKLFIYGEQQVVLPELLAEETTLDLAEDFQQNHVHMEELMNQLDVLHSEETIWNDIFGHLREATEDHIDEEESKMFGNFIYRFSDTELNQMGEIYVQRKQECRNKIQAAA